MLDLTPLQICLNSSTIILREWTVQKNLHNKPPSTKNDPARIV